jgi:NAD(P)H-dependent flavin oxidoreductase YrpB (nitropropane dioxygenase family)
MPYEYHAEVFGSATIRSSDATRGLAYGAVALVGIFLLLQAAVASWRRAGLMLASLPLSAVGGVLTAPLAGGISNIASLTGLFAVMALGAAAAQMGTAYLLCPEATISAIHRAALKSEAARHTALTNIFTGRPARGIMNYAMKELGPINHAAPAFPLATSSIAPLRAKAESAGSGDFTPLWSGQNATGCKEVPAAQLTRELAGGL